jgi:hypothetical protein
MMTTCPNCGASVQSDASFCGQCGFNLKVAAASTSGEIPPPPPSTVAPDFDIPDLVPPDPLVSPDPVEVSGANPAPPAAASVEPIPVPAPSPVVPLPTPPISPGATQLQIQSAKLLHVQTNTVLEIPPSLMVVHLGKQNDRIPPDIDVSGFPNSEIVSRIHADIRLEGDAYYIEDVGSSNGTYINNIPLPMGNRHRLRPGDRIALGKGDKVTFLFQLS